MGTRWEYRTPWGLCPELVEISGCQAAGQSTLMMEGEHAKEFRFSLEERVNDSKESLFFKGRKGK